MTDFSQPDGVRTCEFLQRSSSRFPQFSVRRLGRPEVASLGATSDFAELRSCSYLHSHLRRNKSFMN
jgi:hypothetical protein